MQWLVVFDEAERQQTLDEIGGFRGRADLPAAGRPTPGADVLVDLVAHLRELLGREAKALRHVEGRVVPTAEIDHVAVGDDPLVAWPQRHVRVRVLGELERPVDHHEYRDECQASP